MPSSANAKASESATSIQDNSSHVEDITESETLQTNTEDEFLQYLSTTDKMKKHVRSLLRISDFYSDLMTYHPNPRPYEFIDVICGWEATVSNPSFVMTATTPTVVAKKRRARTIIDDRRQSRVDDCPFSELAEKGLIEPDTYRYIPGNGVYNLVKDNRRLNQKVETNYSFMPKRPSLNTEQRHIQRMINNELKMACYDSKNDDFRDYDEDEPVCAPRSLKGLDSVRIDPDPKGEKDLKLGYTPSVVRTGTKDFRHRRNEKNSVASVEEKSQDSGVLSKAFTERIMRNFTNKITALEDQIRGEANWWAMAADGAVYMSEKRSDRRSNSLPVDTIQVQSLQQQKTSLPLRPLQKIPPTSLQPKVYSCSSQTGPQNTPRYNYLDSYILNPLNLEAARPKQTPRSKDNEKQKITVDVTPRRRRKSRDERIDQEESQKAFQSASVGKPNPRDKKLELINEPDVLTPSVTLPELFGKKLEVAVATQKFL